jgi:hypothetical protein
LIKFKARTNQIIMSNLSMISVLKIHTSSELESILFRIKILILESDLDVSFKTEVDEFLSHHMIQNLAKACHERYLSDISTLKIPSFFKTHWILLIPLSAVCFFSLAWFFLDLMSPSFQWSLLSFVKLATSVAGLVAIKMLFSHFKKRIQFLFAKESEILKSKIFGIIYEKFNLLFENRRNHAS